MKTQKTLGEKIMITIMLILLASLLSQLTLGDLTTKANNDDLQLREYCEGAPECYPIGLQFGDKLKIAILSDQAFNDEWIIPDAPKLFFTSYNPEVGQTDASPCIGANGTNICELAKQGVKTIALSQDLVGRAPYKRFKYGEQVTLISDNPQCNGVFQIEDTMNKRYNMRGDLFQLTRATNTSCHAYIVKHN